jgi:hypothetical protein
MERLPSGVRVVTDKQRLALLREAERELKATGQGYIQWAQDKKGGHWPKALKLLNTLEKDLMPVPVPQLGSIWDGGKSVLLHDLTHKTAGIPLYPAFDDAFNQGRVVIAPEAMTVIEPLTGANPGEAFYCRGRSKLRYWFGHLDRRHSIGTVFVKGEAIGRVAANTIGGGPHCHCGINIELLAGEGKQLSHHTDYTHGAPLIGVQLRNLMEP